MPNKNPEQYRQQAREWYHRHREEILEKNRNASPEQKAIEATRKRQHYLNNKDKIQDRDKLPARRFGNARSMAKNRKHAWLLTLEQYKEIIKDPCYYCDNKLDAPVQKGSGLDRIDSNKGYEIDNVVSCCNFCNGLKSDKLSMVENKAVVGLLIQMRGLNE